MNEISDIVVNLLADFVDKTEEFKGNSIPKCELKLVDDIYKYVLQDDCEYAIDVQESIQRAYGLCYITKKNTITLFIDIKAGMTIISSTLHEFTHAYDFSLMSNCMREKNLRKVQANASFRLWSEFHAEYLTYLYLFRVNGLSKSEIEVFEGLRGELEKFFGENQRMELSKLVDFTVRLYGRYMALLKTYPDTMKKYPYRFFVNKDFLRLYDYLYEHKTFDSIKGNVSELESVFRGLERLSRI